MTTDSLFTMLRKEPNGTPALVVLQPIVLTERPPLVREWCLVAANAHRESEALRLYAWLALAIQDAHGKDAPSHLAQMAIDMYHALPQSRKEHACIDRDSGEMGDIMHPTLVELKKGLLVDVAAYWSVTREEREAPTFEDFLVATGKTRDQNVAEWLTKALREATKHVWKKERALRLALRFLAETPQNDEKNPGYAILTGVMRSLGTFERLQMVEILACLPFDTMGTNWQGVNSAPVFHATLRDVKAYRAMHEAMQELQKALIGTMKGRAKTFEPAYQADPPLINLSIGVATNTWPQAPDAENAFHPIADEMHTKIGAWILERRQRGETVPPIQLRVFWPVHHGEPRLVRNFSFE